MIILASICLNSATIFVILRTRSLRQTGHTILILNLCVADLGVVFSGMPFSLLSVFDGGNFLISHPMICKYLNGYLTIAFSITNFALIFCIAIDRLFLVVFAKRFPPKRRRIYIMVALSWLFGLSITSIRASGVVSGFDFKPSRKSCVAPLAGNAFSIVSAGVLIPIFVMIIIFYASMTFYIWRSDQRLRRHTLVKSKWASKSMASMDKDASKAMRLDVQGSAPQTSSPVPPESERNEETLSPVVLETVFSDQLEKPDDDEGDTKGSLPNGGTSDTKYMSIGRTHIHQAHRRVAKMGVILISASTLCWTPYFIYHADWSWVPKAHWFRVFAMWLAYCHTLTDPLVYAFMNRRVRAEMTQMVKRAKRQLLIKCRHYYCFHG
eukprot:XP_011680509.1 PREDICTED: D(4) dopamine receptor-like [Strongylocentrotus purpuratus]